MIFEPYHRYHDELTRPGSIGLGLTVSRGLAERMDGTLKYRHDGQQSRFTLHLPKKQDSSTG
jgi:signal transduction histidine kinase